MGVEVNAVVAENDVDVVATLSATPAIPVTYEPQTGGGDGLTNEIKDALLQIARKVVYVDAGGQTYYNALYNALYPLDYIDAVFTQTGTVYTTDSLDTLKNDLVVTAHYTGGSTAVVTDYTLSGTLTEGTSVVTVTYVGETTTFNVTVTAPPAVLVSIDAVFTQGQAVIYDTDSLDTLKQYLVVTATYSDSTTETVPSSDYTLSGTLTEGTSTVTASYLGKTDTFTVTVTHEGMQVLHNWDFTSSLDDTVGGVTASLARHTSSSLPSRDSNGVNFTAYGQCIDLGEVYDRNISIDIEMSAISIATGTGHVRFFMYGNGTGTGTGLMIYRYSGQIGWKPYIGGTWGNKFGDLSNRNSLDTAGDVKLTFKIAADGTFSLYKDDVLVDTSNLTAPEKSSSISHLYIGNTESQGGGGGFFAATVERVKIYREV